MSVVGIYFAPVGLITFSGVTLKATNIFNNYKYNLSVFVRVYRLLCSSGLCFSSFVLLAVQEIYCVFNKKNTSLFLTQACHLQEIQYYCTFNLHYWKLKILCILLEGDEVDVERGVDNY